MTWGALGVLSFVALIIWLRWEDPGRIKRKMGFRKRGIAGTSEAISTIHNSWKSPECDESSSLQRFIGDFGHEDHLFIDLRINHCVQSLDPRLVLPSRCDQSLAQVGCKSLDQ